MKYLDLKIKSQDMIFIEELAETYEVDYTEAEINDFQYTSITNQVIQYILEKADMKLDISDKARDLIRDSMYINYRDSWFNIDEHIINESDLSDSDKETLINFINI